MKHMTLHLLPEKDSMRVWMRAAALGLALALMIPSVGCDRAKKKKEAADLEKWRTEEAEAAATRRALNEGEAIVAEFATDGRWHPLPYAVHSGQVMRVETFGATSNYGDNIVEFRLGARKMIVSNRREFIVSEAGPIAVRVNPKRVPGLGPAAQIQITRMR